MGRRSQERATGRTFEERRSRAKGLGARIVRAVRSRFSDGKSHRFGVGNVSRDGVPRDRFTNQAISLKREVEPEEESR